MKKRKICDRSLKTLFLRSSVVFLLLTGQNSSQAQIANDNSLPVNSQVHLNGTRFKIEGGTTNQNQTNLFHSFSEFSLPHKFEAFFNNSPAIRNIFARVTGNKLSNINGQIRANGSASLFLLNPNGILFGPNASVNIGGSFVATTANSVVFANESEFSATNPQSVPLLNVNRPVGLHFRNNQGTIRVQNTGHQLFREGANFIELIASPILGRQLTPGLQVDSANTLAFVGSSVVLDGGILRAEAGRIELGSADSGLVALLANALGWTLAYEGVTSFGDIELDRQALVDVSGNRSGFIQVQGASVSIANGSTILSQNQGNNSAGTIEVEARELLAIQGISSNKIITSQITSLTQGTGAGGDINVITPKLLMREGGRIGTLVEGSGRGGNITVNAADSVELDGSAPPPNLRSSQIITETNSFDFGQTGDISLATEQLIVRDGANIISAINVGNGSASDVTIDATESILLEGIGDNTLPCLIGGVSIAGTGDVGDLTINTPRLVVRDGGNVNRSVLGQGNAGDIVIKAFDSVEIIGEGSDIISSAQQTPEIIVQLLELPEEPSGESGNITINTPRLVIAEEGQVTVRNDGTGDAGELFINADSILLDDGGSVTASTASGEGGNITLNLEDLLQLRNDSLISATADGTGNGGNININTPLLAVFPPTSPDGSDIIANAARGNGGNILIDAQGIFGITERSAIPGNQTNNIDASSEFGLEGEISIVPPEIDPSQGLVELPETVVDPSDQIARNPCQQGEESEFIVIGRGGLPSNPSEVLSREATGVGLVEAAPMNRGVALEESREAEERVVTASSVTQTIKPAQGWLFNDKGEVVLTAYSSTSPQRLLGDSSGCSAL